MPVQLESHCAFVVQAAPTLPAEQVLVPRLHVPVPNSSAGPGAPQKRTSNKHVYVPPLVSPALVAAASGNPVGLGNTPPLLVVTAVVLSVPRPTPPVAWPQVVPTMSEDNAVRSSLLSEIPCRKI